jgi:hypothetical protein
MGIYIPHPGNAAVQAFIATYAPAPTGAINDDFRSAVLAYLEVTDTGQSIDDVWKLFLTDKYGTFVGLHVANYEPEANFEFVPEE